MLVNEFLEKTAESFPGKSALIFQGKRLTYAEIDTFASSFGNALIEAGFQRQQRAVVCLDNSVESVVSLFGILKAGGVFVLIDPKVKARKLAYIVNDCLPAVLVTDASHFTQLFEVMKEFPCPCSIILTDHEKTAAPTWLGRGIKVLSYETMAESSISRRPAPTCIDIDLASLVYTSGSSGSPKGVMLTHLNMVSAANSITQYLQNTPDDIIIDTLPLSFDYGLYQLLMTFKFGGTLVLEKGFVFPQQIIDIVVREKVTGWPIVPTIAAILLRLKNLEEHDFSRLKYITSTGQVFPPKHIARFRKIFPNAKIYSMYGLTECKRVSYLHPDELEKRPSSVGKAIPNTEAYIVDDGGSEIREAGKPGVLMVRGANVMKGYWNLPEETARALLPGSLPGEKVLCTGDVFKKDEDGFLYFLGRKDDIIKTSGHMVSPKEVENVLCEMEDVSEAAVIGVKDEVLGQAVKAFVHLTDASRVSDEDIIRFCHEYLEDFAVPKYVRLCGPLPRTNSGKIDKRQLQ
jgi:long-chain acyl-CoA synthetase